MRCRWFLVLSVSAGVASKVEILEGLDGLVGIGPAARGVIEALVGEEVLIGGVEGCAAGAVQAVGVDLDLGGIC